VVKDETDGNVGLSVAVVVVGKEKHRSARVIGTERSWSRDTSNAGMFRPPAYHSIILRSFPSPRPVFSHGRRFYAQFKVDKAVEEFDDLSTDEQLERLTKLNASADNNPDVDLWSLNADLLGQ
jgi:hypothetical protein